MCSLQHQDSDQPRQQTPSPLATTSVWVKTNNVGHYRNDVYVSVVRWNHWFHLDLKNGMKDKSSNATMLIRNPVRVSVFFLNWLNYFKSLTFSMKRLMWVVLQRLCVFLFFFCDKGEMQCSWICPRVLFKHEQSKNFTHVFFFSGWLKKTNQETNKQKKNDSNFSTYRKTAINITEMQQILFKNHKCC